MSSRNLTWLDSWLENSPENWREIWLEIRLEVWQEFWLKIWRFTVNHFPHIVRLLVTKCSLWSKAKRSQNHDPDDRYANLKVIIRSFDKATLIKSLYWSQFETENTRFENNSIGIISKCWIICRASRLAAPDGSLIRCPACDPKVEQQIASFSQFSVIHTRLGLRLICQKCDAHGLR